MTQQQMNEGRQEEKCDCCGEQLNDEGMKNMKNMKNRMQVTKINGLIAEADELHCPEGTHMVLMNCVVVGAVASFALSYSSKPNDEVKLKVRGYKPSEGPWEVFLEKTATNHVEDADEEFQPMIECLQVRLRLEYP